MWIFWQILRNSRPPIGEKKLRRKGKLFCLSCLILEKISKYLTLKMANPQNCTTLIKAVTQRFDPPHCAPCLSLSNGCQPLSMLWIVSLVNLTLNYEAWIKTSFLLNWNAFSENKRFIKIFFVDLAFSYSSLCIRHEHFAHLTSSISDSLRGWKFLLSIRLPQESPHHIYIASDLTQNVDSSHNCDHMEWFSHSSCLFPMDRWIFPRTWYLDSLY